MPSKLTLEQAAWLTLFALIGIICMFRLEQMIAAMGNVRVIVMRDGGGAVIDAKYVDLTGTADYASSMPDSP